MADYTLLELGLFLSVILAVGNFLIHLTCTINFVAWKIREELVNDPYKENKIRSEQDSLAKAAAITLGCFVFFFVTTIILLIIQIL